MSRDEILILSYIAFMWLVLIHTFEEIADGVLEIEFGKIKVTKKKYLFGASMISTLNLGTLAMLVFSIPLGYYFGLFTSAVIGVFQALVHGVGFFKEGKKTRGLGVGFYSSIPLAIMGLVVLIQIIQILNQ